MTNTRGWGGGGKTSKSRSIKVAVTEKATLGIAAGIGPRRPRLHQHPQFRKPLELKHFFAAFLRALSFDIRETSDFLLFFAFFLFFFLHTSGFSIDKLQASKALDPAAAPAISDSHGSAALLQGSRPSVSRECPYPRMPLPLSDAPTFSPRPPFDLRCCICVPPAFSLSSSPSKASFLSHSQLHPVPSPRALGTRETKAVRPRPQPQPPLPPRTKSWGGMG